MTISPTAAADAADRLRGWLLSGAVQCHDGAQAGGIFGAFDTDGAARYVYPEITGYYLHWLAEVSSQVGVDAVRPMAAQAADWASRVLANGGVPATRSYLGREASDDWRNHAVFFFDLSMLLRGLCAATEAGLIDLPVMAVARLIEELGRFVDARGDIVAARLLTSGYALPPRWSTLGGPFEVKATSRVTLAARHAPLPSTLASACTQLAQRYLPETAQLPLQMLHPTLYFAEGMLVAEPASRSDVHALVQRCIALGDAHGNLPEAEDSRVPRSDIVAQALRVGLLSNDAIDVEAERLAVQLMARIRADGSLPFRVDVPDPQPNVWCAMFAEQALRWYAQRQRGLALPAAEWLV